jgi:hypothetical protein
LIRLGESYACEACDDDLELKIRGRVKRSESKPLR